jgi:hypothetical protein
MARNGAAGTSGYLKNKKKTANEIDGILGTKSKKKAPKKSFGKNMTPVDPKTGKIIRKK